MELWLAKMNSDVRSLQRYYPEGKSRLETYREMVDVMLVEVRAGKRVCGAFYGHLGVFAWLSTLRGEPVHALTGVISTPGPIEPEDGPVSSSAHAQAEIRAVL
ncbi:MAG TPA: hypothetical protein VF745_08190 [Steroidobacteraceae bacterium]